MKVDELKTITRISFGWIFRRVVGEDLANEHLTWKGMQEKIQKGRKQYRRSSWHLDVPPVVVFIIVHRRE